MATVCESLWTIRAVSLMNEWPRQTRSDELMCDLISFRSVTRWT